MSVIRIINLNNYDGLDKVLFMIVTDYYCVYIWKSELSKKRDFKYVGSITIYSHLQVCGIINDHDRDCSCYQRIVRNFPNVSSRRDYEIE